MPNVDWRLKGPELATCNCDWGCPCQFNALPSHGDCKAAVAMRIDEGHFGDTRLEGLAWVGMFAWPGPIHEGKGQAQAVIDVRADERQREALLAILSGQESEPGATHFSIFASMVERFHPPLFRPIEFEADLAARRGRFRVEGVIDALGEPIRNPITGKDHRVSVQLPHGFEFTSAEFASSRTRSTGPVALDWSKGHAHFTTLHTTPQGPVRA